METVQTTNSEESTAGLFSAGDTTLDLDLYSGAVYTKPYLENDLSPIPPFSSAGGPDFSL